jgi:hypothetical protein
MKWKARKSPILYSVIAAAIVFPLSGTVLSTPDSTNRSLSGKCNVFMVGKLATNDGSVINSQTAGTTRAWYHPPADYDAGAVRSLKCFNEYDRSFLDARYAFHIEISWCHKLKRADLVGYPIDVSPAVPLARP